MFLKNPPIFYWVVARTFYLSTSQYHYLLISSLTLELHIYVLLPSAARVGLPHRVDQPRPEGEAGKVHQVCLPRIAPLPAAQGPCFL